MAVELLRHHPFNRDLLEGGDGKLDRLDDQGHGYGTLTSVLVAPPHTVDAQTPNDTGKKDENHRETLMRAKPLIELRIC